MSATVLVEGESDRRALGVLAPAHARSIVVMNGITNLRAHLRSTTGPVRLLHDAAEQRWVTGVLAEAERDVRTFVCDRDLEDELIRAVGVEGVLAVIEEQGERAAYERMAQQPAQRDRPDADRLRRWLGARSGHKATYAELLTIACRPGSVPAPLRDLVVSLRGQ